MSTLLSKFLVHWPPNQRYESPTTAIEAEWYTLTNSGAIVFHGSKGGVRVVAGFTRLQLSVRWQDGYISHKGEPAWRYDAINVPAACIVHLLVGFHPTAFSTDEMMSRAVLSWYLEHEPRMSLLEFNRLRETVRTELAVQFVAIEQMIQSDEFEQCRAAMGNYNVDPFHKLLAKFGVSRSVRIKRP